MMCFGIERQRTGTLPASFIHCNRCMFGWWQASFSLPSLALRVREDEGGNDQIALLDNLVIMQSSKIKSEGSLTALYILVSL
jgi:hypothetical protein